MQLSKISLATSKSESIQLRTTRVLEASQWMMLSSFISERQIRHMSCCIGVSEETDGGGELDLGGKFLLLSHWLKKVRRPLIGQYQPIRNLQISTNQRSSCNQSETSMRLSTNKRAVGTFLLNLISRPHQSLRRLRCSRTYV